MSTTPVRSRRAPTPAADSGFGGIGPFTIDSAAGYSFTCPAQQFCTEQQNLVIPGGSPVTITVTGEGGNVGVGTTG